MKYGKGILSTILLFIFLGCSDTSLNLCSETAEDMFGCECVPEYTEVYIWEIWGYIYDGDEGGIAGFDAECVVDAPNVTLPPGTYTYRAVISDSTRDVRSYMNRCSGPIRDEAGAIITNTWADYFDPNVTTANPVALALTTETWSGMDANGAPSANNCNNWTSSSSTDSGNLADPTAVNSDRFHDTTLSTCDQDRTVHCVAYSN